MVDSGVENIQVHQFGLSKRKVIMKRASSLRYSPSVLRLKNNYRRNVRNDENGVDPWIGTQMSHEESALTHLCRTPECHECDLLKTQ